jgi:dipeptidase E
MPHIVAMGGGGFSDDDPLLDRYVLDLTGRPRPRVCFVPTASGDAESYVERFFAAFAGQPVETSCLRLFEREHADLRSFLLGQDVIYVGGGNTANMLLVWRLHGVDAVLREAWRSGIVLCGLSAGGLCWFEGGSTDSFGGLAWLDDGLGLLSGSFCPHYDGEPGRRPTYRRFVGEGRPAGYAADDFAALHFSGTTLEDVVTSRGNARAYLVDRHEDDVRETELAWRLLSG